MEPIACKLEVLDNHGDQRANVAGLLAKITNPVETPQGYRFQLPASDVGEVGAWIAEERVCCSFFDFDLSLKAGSDLMQLTLGGGEGVKDFITSEIFQRTKVRLQEGSDQ
jgi:hypothetical protein